jgi:hypothetical protein
MVITFPDKPAAIFVAEAFDAPPLVGVAVADIVEPLVAKVATSSYKVLVKITVDEFAAPLL